MRCRERRLDIECSESWSGAHTCKKRGTHATTETQVTLPGWAHARKRSRRRKHTTLRTKVLPTVLELHICYEVCTERRSSACDDLSRQDFGIVVFDDDGKLCAAAPNADRRRRVNNKEVVTVGICKAIPIRGKISITCAAGHPVSRRSGGVVNGRVREARV